MNKSVGKEGKYCKFCNDTGVIWSAFVGNWVPCNTENDCLYSELQQEVSENTRRGE